MDTPLLLEVWQATPALVLGTASSVVCLALHSTCQCKYQVDVPFATNVMIISGLGGSLDRRDN